MVTLEQPDAQPTRTLVLVAGLDLLRHELQRPRAQRAHDLRQPLACDLLHVELDDIDQPDQLAHAVEIACEIRYGNAVPAGAQLAQTCKRLRREARHIDELEHDALRGQRLDQLAEQELGVDVEITVEVAEHLGNTDLGEDVGNDRGRGIERRVVAGRGGWLQRPRQDRPSAC